MRETGEEYEDFTSRALPDLLKHGLVAPVDEDARTLAASLKVEPVHSEPTPTAEPVVTDGEKKE